MRVGVPSEVKNNEFRVAITPSGVHELVAHGHEVHIQAGAGLGSSISDDDYRAAGATIAEGDNAADDVWATADVLLKVKEPIESEYRHFRDGLVLFTYLHLAAEAALTSALIESGVTAIAYETVQLPNGSLPLLAPMSEVAGRLAPIVGANAMLRPHGGPGLLVPGVAGTHPANVVVIGAGVAGTNAVALSVGLGAQVIVLDTNIQRLRELDDDYAGRIVTIASNSFELERAVLAADLVIGAVLVPGAKAPKLVSNDLVRRMKPGSVLVDIAVDQGGCFADTRPTTHADPTYPVHGSIFYCVANMPGAVAHTSTYALTNATLPYVRAIANSGWRDALRADPALALGLNVHAGQVVNTPVATAHGLASGSLESALA
ncbi:alanine dehydrogenase [Pseudolysinimonas yzui]|uniref:Alanine dehydrogenase n=1 Tax=Pseudolysinimonas yzui TaxID=2708254 RepID=A0A8J3GNG3_9MICO|nr:alanine dehydrogenase [Pseudolysinimonas yzui]GHF07355.1 alanine dehydrogenase [Pseudolysinimonas yzui]